MQNGVIVESDATETLFRHHRHPYTKKLFAASRHIPRQIALPSNAERLLDVSNLSVGYAGQRGLFTRQGPDLTAVNDVSFSIDRGESLGLVGESGCGKSTLARTILGLQALRSGQISLLGKSVGSGQHVPASLRAAMQVVFQDPYGSFNPRHRVGRLIAEPLHLLADPPQGTDREKDIERALEEVGLAASDKHKFIHEFSGGQRQRIAIARALVIKPALVILDEAVSALDVSIRAQIIDLLVELRESHGLSYLFISHDLTVVRSVTERVMVMRAGQIVEQGDTADILDSPAHSYTKQLVAASPQIPADWLATGGQHGTRNIKGDA
jgi:peptide/nickel transport system ATP-binding protein